MFAYGQRSFFAGHGMRFRDFTRSPASARLLVESGRNWPSPATCCHNIASKKLQLLTVETPF
jgi:hypothetical protein